MTNEEMLTCLQEAEKEINVGEFIYKGISFWPVLRVMLYAENVGRNGGIEVRKTDRNKIIGFMLQSVFERFYDRKNNQSLQSADGYFLTASSNRNFIQGKGYFNIYASPLVEWGDGYNHIDEMVPLGDYRLPRSEESNFIQFGIYLRYLFGSVLSKKRTREVEWSDEWGKLLRYLFAVGYKTNITIQKLFVRLEQLSLLSLWFEKRLNKINPKYVAVICYYSTPAFALMHAANRLNIRTIDLQHGVQGKNHVAYGAYYNIPAQGWNLLPNVFWNWTQQDAEHINSWGDGKHQGLNGGIIWHHYLQNTPELNKDWFDKLSAINIGNKAYVLVTFQSLKNNHALIEELQKIIVSEKGKNYFWLLRLHPSMPEQMMDYKKLFNMSNCNVELATAAPLPLLLEKTVLHITRYSSVVIEAAMYGITSFVEEGRAFYQDYEKNNKITYFSNDLQEKFVAQKINLQNDEKHSSLIDSEQIWQELLERG